MIVLVIIGIGLHRKSFVYIFWIIFGLIFWMKNDGYINNHHWFDK